MVVDQFQFLYISCSPAVVLPLCKGTVRMADYCGPCWQVRERELAAFNEVYLNSRSGFFVLLQRDGVVDRVRFHDRFKMSIDADYVHSSQSSSFIHWSHGLDV